LKKFIADWKNPALLGAGIVVVLLLVLLFVERARSMNARLATVGDTIITRQSVLDEFKRQGGDDTVFNMVIGALFASYGKTEKVTASAGEIGQFEKVSAVLAAATGKSLNESVVAQGLTMAQWRQYYADQIVHIKLVVPEKDIQAYLKQFPERGQFPYTIPAWYRYRRFVILEKKDADKAYGLLQKPDGVAATAALSLPNAQSDTIRYFIRGTAENDLPQVLAQLPTIKAGQISKPFQVEVPQGPKLWVIVQMLEYIPQEQPTLENRGMLIGQKMMGDQAFGMVYRQREQDIITKAFQKIDVTFSPGISEFKQAFDELTKLKNQSIYVPPATGSPVPGLPGAGPSGGGLIPQSAPPAPGGQ